ncbi:hypothetical protein M2323_000345 [Rhodoblastus acidophilus]|uniref:hypothetical protein n=1 Tax=Rhodoblastus acidophilus TaxID=1074 RepID=UPI00222471C8|nr:hypothetical protein [Rhodoblastus acidophilus]MCW2282584.1 hypothetical protein [Rhodoblastus acidophilus]MCW2331445.1 hypothetical protein [Rhodoblastus acidophilus]
MIELDGLDELIAKILMLRKSLGKRIYRDAITKASAAVGQTALAEAERRAAKRSGKRRPTAVVIRFPVTRRKPGEQR